MCNELSKIDYGNIKEQRNANELHLIAISDVPLEAESLKGRK